jgi:hypothetical protein
VIGGGGQFPEMPLGYLTDILQGIVSGRTKNHELHV